MAVYVGVVFGVAACLLIRLVSRERNAWGHGVQVGIGVAGVLLGIYEAATGELILGLLVAALACTAGALAISRLRRS